MFKLLEFLTRLGGFLVPPVAPTDPSFWDQLRLRLVACAAFLGVVVLALAAYGLIPQIDGFARTKSLNEVLKAIGNAQAYTIQSQLFEIRVRECQTASNELREALTQRITELEQRYHDLTQEQYVVVPCGDL